MKNIFNSARQAWIKLADKRKPLSAQAKHFLKNVGVGIIIVLGVQVMQTYNLARGWEDYAMDVMMRLQAHAGLVGNQNGPKFIFIDIDEKSYKEWKMQDAYHAPRDKLLNLIKYAAHGNAKAILVDIDLSRPGVKDEHGHDYNDELSGYFSTYKTKDADKDWPELFLMQTFEPCCLDDSLPHVRKAFFDVPASPANPAIHWVQPLFVEDANDHEIRRWQLLKSGCLDGKPVWIPSAQLAIDMLLAENKGNAWETNKDAQMLRGSLPPTCGGIPEIPDGATVEYKDRKIKVEADKLGQSIMYTFFYQLKPGEDQPGFIRIPAWKIPVVDDGQKPLAHTGGDKSSASGNNSHETIVIIGASYRDSQDIHHTPMGDMPGALIILSAIKSLNNYNQLHENIGLKWLIEIGFIFIMAAVFGCFGPWKSVGIIGALLGVLAVISFHYFHSGLWVDFVGPFIGMQAHRWSAEFEEKKQLAGKKKQLEIRMGELKNQLRQKVKLRMKMDRIDYCRLCRRTINYLFTLLGEGNNAENNCRGGACGRHCVWAGRGGRRRPSRAERGRRSLFGGKL